MTTYTDVDKFLQAIFPDFDKFAIFANLNPPSHTRDFRQLDLKRDCYWSVAAFPDGDRSPSRTLTRALDVRALVIDDVGTKVPAAAVELALGPATAIVETSSGNFQWVYRLAAPIPAAQWGGFWREIETLVGQTLEGKDAVHLFRLPCGVNTKPERNGFEVRLDQLNSGVQLNVINWDHASVSSTRPKHDPPRGSTLDKTKLESLMQLVPNDLERDGWIEVGHGLKALCADDEEGFEVFDHWSLQHPSYDAGKTRTAWDSFGASGLRTHGGKLRARAEGLDREGFTKWDAALVFDDDAEPPPEVPKGKGITATPFKWKDPAGFPLRDWIYGKLLIRKFISMTVAPGGVGKSSLVATEALAQVTARNLLGDKPSKPLRVWIWNLEDPLEETERKLQTAALHYGISEADIGDRLFVDSGRQQKLVIARMQGRDGAMIMQPVVDALVSEIKRREIDIVVVDPFVSCHAVPENDNTAQDMIVKEWGAVAERGNCAVHLLDHTRKAPSGTEVETESSRGAKAKTDAARVVRVINRMTDAVGKSHGISDPWQYFNTFHDKSNMAPPINHRPWFHLESVNMGNGGVMDGVGAARMAGESVGVVVQWTPPSASDVVTSENFKKAATVLGNKLWRMDNRSPNWWGFVVAPVLEIDATKEQGKKQLDALVKAWLNAGVAQEVKAFDERRRPKQFIQITGGF